MVSEGTGPFLQKELRRYVWQSIGCAERDAIVHGSFSTEAAFIGRSKDVLRNYDVDREDRASGRKKGCWRCTAVIRVGVEGFNLPSPMTKVDKGTVGS